PVAAWIDAGTLVYAAPEAWREGLPQRVTLYRVTLRDAEPTPLLTLRAHGADRGVAVTDLAAAPDGAWLAYRVRHFGTGGAAADSLHLAPAHDVTQALEAARGEAAEGMAWSPDGRWLAAALDDRVLLLTADGRTTVPLTGPATAASYPLWVVDDEVWFTLDEGRGPRIMRVRLRCWSHVPLSLAVFREDAEQRGRGDPREPLILPQDEQVSILGDKIVGIARHGRREELVVIGIATDRRGLGRLDHVRLRQEGE